MLKVEGEGQTAFAQGAGAHALKDLGIDSMGVYPEHLDQRLDQQTWTMNNDLSSKGVDNGNGESSSLGRLGSLRPSTTDSKEEVLRFLGRCLVLPVVDGRYKTPVVTLHNSDTSNLYSLLEKQLRTEYLVGAEKFWKIVRLDQHLDTWRPRVHGTQLKALLNCRLPEQPEEYVAAEKAVASIKWALRPDTSPENFIAELRKFVAGVEVWWDHRNSRRPPTDVVAASTGSLKRPASNMASAPPSKQQMPAMQMPMQTNQSMPGTGPALRKASGSRPQEQPLVSTSPVYGASQQGAGMMRMHGSFSENGFNSRESPDDLAYGTGNGTGELGNFMQAAQRGVPGGVPGGPGGPGMMGARSSALPSPSEPNALVYLNVGGVAYTTTVNTLTSVPGSLFWDLLGHHSNMVESPARTASGELFLDRNGKVFSFVLEYLRAAANKEMYYPLPEDAGELATLAREAEYFGLSGLVDRIRNSAIMPQASTQAVYDSIYLETGFNSIEGPSLKEMEQRKVVVMQQMNHVLAQKALDGFFVAACDCGVNHREGQDGMQHNLFYHILLKKVMPVPPGLPPTGMHHALAAAHMQQQQHAMAMGAGQAGLQQGGMPISMPMQGMQQQMGGQAMRAHAG